MTDRSRHKYPMVIPNPATAHLNYLDREHCVMWQDFVGQWQSYAQCVADLNRYFKEVKR